MEGMQVKKYGFHAPVVKLPNLDLLGWSPEIEYQVSPQGILNHIPVLEPLKDEKQVVCYGKGKILLHSFSSILLFTSYSPFPDVCFLNHAQKLPEIKSSGYVVMVLSQADEKRMDLKGSAILEVL